MVVGGINREEGFEEPVAPGGRQLADGQKDGWGGMGRVHGAASLIWHVILGLPSILCPFLLARLWDTLSPWPRLGPRRRNKEAQGSR